MSRPYVHRQAPAMTKAYKRTALGMVLTMRENLDTIDAEGLARSHGADVLEVREMIAAEQRRRAERSVA